MMGEDQKDRGLLPKATINSQGSVEISFIEQNCTYNAGYCDQDDPSAEQMNKVSTAIVNEIADGTNARVYLMHFDGSRSNQLRQNVRKSVTVISALPDDFDYAIKDDVMGFDERHPGPWWNYAISQKLIGSLPP
jgi:hypothetical protein